jgi:hypothetical protein
MSDSRPLWRQGFDEVDRRLSPRVEHIVHSEQFADATVVASRLQSQLRRRTERALRQGWHFWNLPAGSDVKRLSDQVASLERRVRDLSKQLEEAEGNERGGARGKRAQSDRSRRTPPA